jgi:hypothetical protein
MFRTFLIVHALIASSFLAAEAPSSKPKSAESQISVKSLPIDPQKLAAALNGSFYHPDQLSGIQCAVAVDWQSFFGALNVKIPDARKRAVDGLQIHYDAVRNKRPEVNFVWANGRADTADQLEDGTRQIISGFYQMYWPMMASALAPKPEEIGRVESQPDGTIKVFQSDPNSKIGISLNKNSEPVHWDVDTPAYKGAFDLDFVDSPSPAPGDLHRLSKLHIVTNTGASTMNVLISLDYQPVDGVNIPHHVTYDIVGAYSISLEFIGCTVSKTAEVPASQ